MMGRHRSSAPVGDPPQSAVRHLVMVDLFVSRPIPTTLFQIIPQCASGTEGHMAAVIEADIVANAVGTFTCAAEDLGSGKLRARYCARCSRRIARSPHHMAT